MRYPPSYAPRDNLAVTDEMLDWTGDHLHTNMRDLFIWLREQGYYVETLGCAFTCFNATECARTAVPHPTKGPQPPATPGPHPQPATSDPPTSRPRLDSRPRRPTAARLAVQS